MCTINTTISVVFPECKPVILKDYLECDGSKFIKITKSDSAVVRLLTGHGVGVSRNLARSDIIESLITLRNSKSDELLKESMSGGSGATDDLGKQVEQPRLYAKRMKRAASALPEVLEIRAPAFKDVESVNMNFLRQRPDQPLWVELTPENLDYLRAYVSAQIEDGSVKIEPHGAARPEDAETARAPGLVWSTNRLRFRVRYTDDDGEKHTKDFKESPLAMAFARSVRQSEQLPLQDGLAADQSDQLPLQDGLAADQAIDDAF